MKTTYRPYNFGPPDCRLSTAEQALQAVARRQCGAAGHRWVDTSYGGPEGGRMSMECARCGYSFHHTLY